MVAVLVIGVVVFFGCGCLLAVLEVVGLGVTGFCYHDLRGWGWGRVFQLLAVSICLDTSSITGHPLQCVTIVSFFPNCLAFVSLLSGSRIALVSGVKIDTRRPPNNMAPPSCLIMYDRLAII